jgi:hypothetical protein
MGGKDRTGIVAALLLRLAGVSLTTIGEDYAITAANLEPSTSEWIPQVEDPRWQQYLEQLAKAADARARQLGEQTAEAGPQWAAESLGPVPRDPEGRDEWVRRAGIVAAHRELTGHHDPESALGAAPQPGQAEAFASWRASWRALGRVEADRDAAELSDGQLHMRVRAWERERAWGPRYVANELAGTSQAAARHRDTAAVRRAEAEAAPDIGTRARLEREAHDAAALADVLDAQAAQLVEADDIRALWYAHTAPTRVTADRARAELAGRGTERGDDEPLVTAEEWLAEHRDATREDDLHRVASDELDLADVNTRRRADLADAFPEPAADAAEWVPPATDRKAPAAQPNEDVVRVPTAEETAATIARARAALAEIERREAADGRHAAEEARSEQLTRWHTADEAAIRDPAREQQVQAVMPVFEPASPWD